MSRSEVKPFVQAQSLLRAEQSTAPDRLQPTLLRRFGFRRQVSAGVRRRNQTTKRRGGRHMPIHTITGGGGLQLAVHEYGQPHGKPILLIHGFSQCHLVWSKQYQSPLADEFRLVCIDNRGHGMSEKPTALEYYTQAELWADDVQAVITGLALRKPVLAGWSYGGFVINDYLA